MRPLILALFVLGAGSILGAAILLAPENAGSRYWISITWGEILFSANWYASTLIFVGGNEKETRKANLQAIGPALSLVVFVYSLISVAALTAFYFDLIATRTHMLVQLFSLSVAGFILMFALLAYRGARE